MSNLQGNSVVRYLKVLKQRFKIKSIADVKYGIIDKLVNEDVNFFEVLSPKQYKILLFHSKWDRELLADRFYEADSLEDFVKKYDIDLDVPLSDEEIVDSFIRSNSLYKWCPNKLKGKCDRLVKLDSADVQEVTCACGLSYCFKCDDIPHLPLPCNSIEEWKQQFVEPEPSRYNFDVQCPRCYKFIHVTEEITECICTKCCNKVRTGLIKKEREYPPEYYDYDRLLDKIKSLYSMKADLEKRRGGYKFLLTANMHALMLLQKMLVLPLFSFFLDKNRLSYHSFNFETLEGLDKMLKNDADSLMKLMYKSEYDDCDYCNDYEISQEEAGKIRDALTEFQKHLDMIFKFIKDNANDLRFTNPKIRVILNNEVLDDEILDDIENLNITDI